MTLKEAIEINKDLQEIVFIDKSPDRKKAVMLGIEAMKYITRARRQRVPNLLTYLPGETVDTDSPQSFTIQPGSGG